MSFGLGDLNPVHILQGEGAIGQSGLGSLVVGAGLAAMGVPPMFAALGTGAATAALTGNLQKGLFAGMGAYGGAGLMGGLEGLGAAANPETVAAQNAAQTANELELAKPSLADQALQKESIAADAFSTPEQVQAVQGAAQPTATPVNAAQTGQTVQTTTQAPSLLERTGQNLSNAGAGIDRLTTSGGIDALRAQMATGAGLNAPSMNQALGVGAAGILGGSSLLNQKNPAATASQSPGYIRQYSFDPFRQRYTAFAPVAADKWGSRSFEDAYKAADGGIVALAGGGSLAEQRLADYQQYAAAQQPQAAPAPAAIPAPAQPAAAPANTMTGGSKQAFDYLMGKAEYSPVPWTPTGEVYKPYSEAVMGIPRDPTQFATNFNPTTRKYEDNPNYKPFNLDAATGTTTRGLSANELKAFIADPKNLAQTKPDTVPTGWLAGAVNKVIDAAEPRPYWMVANNITYDDLAKATGSSLADVQKRFPKTATTTPVPVSAVDTGYSSSFATGGITALAGGGLGSLGGYSDGGHLLKGPGDGVSDSIPASIGGKQPARLADGEFVVPARIVSELGNGSTDAGARKLYQMMDRVQQARGKTTGKGKVATNSRADKYLPV